VEAPTEGAKFDNGTLKVRFGTPEHAKETTS
jgi:hypothetical protein